MVCLRTLLFLAECVCLGQLIELKVVIVSFHYYYYQAIIDSSSSPSGKKSVKRSLQDPIGEVYKNSQSLGHAFAYVRAYIDILPIIIGMTRYM